MRREDQDRQLGPSETPGDNQPAPVVDGSMSWIDHLEELRSTLIGSVAAAFLGTIGCWFVSRPLLDMLVAPILEAAEGVYFHTPIEAFMTRLKLAAICGLFLVLPYIFFRLYGFILPGLYAKERKVITPLLVSSTALFYLGVGFAYLVVIPQVVTFMLSFGTEIMQPLIGIGPYFAFVARLCLAFGIMFELPLVVLFLSSIGLVNPRMLLRTWRYALIIIVVFAAVLTPPDVFSQLMMAGPVMLLYIGSVLIAMVVTRRKERSSQQDEDEDEAEDDPDVTATAEASEPPDDRNENRTPETRDDD
ncbi:MAG: twin-arginine translocase subunit TatC [bacterium]